MQYTETRSPISGPCPLIPVVSVNNLVRDKSTGARPLRGLALVVAIQGATQVILLALIPVISARCNIGIATIGSLVAIGTLCLMLAGPLWGLVSDRYGRKPVVLAGLAGTFLAQTLFVGLLLGLADGRREVTDTLILLGVSRALYGLSAAGIYPACQAWAVELSDGNPGLASLAQLSAAANLGRGLGPLLVLSGLAAGGLWSLGWLLLLPLLAMLVVTLIPTVCRRESQETQAPWLNRPLWTLFATALLATLTTGQLQLALGPVLMDFYRLNPVRASSTAALLLAGLAVWGFLLQWGLVRKLRAPQLALTAGAVLLMAGAVVLNGTLGSVGALAGLLLFVAGVALLTPGYTALLSEMSGHQRGRLFGLLSLMHTAGYTAGFALGGWIVQWQPARPLAGLLAGALLIALAAALAIRGTGRHVVSAPG